MLEIRLTFAPTFVSPVWLFVTYLSLRQANGVLTLSKRNVTTPANSEDIWHVLTFEAIWVITNFVFLFVLVSSGLVLSRPQNSSNYDGVSVGEGQARNRSQRTRKIWRLESLLCRKLLCRNVTHTFGIIIDGFLSSPQSFSSSYNNEATQSGIMLYEYNVGWRK
jgi:hypothetical protein